MFEVNNKYDNTNLRMHRDSSAVNINPLQQAFTVRVLTLASVLYPVV